VLTLDGHLVRRLMPHRGHMMLLDRVAAYYPTERLAVGIKNVSQNDPVVQGHFPDHPVFPGSLLIEALAQASGLLMNIEYLRNKAGFDVARLVAAELPDAPLGVPITVLVDSKIQQLATVLPGDQVQLRSQLVLQHGEMGHFQVSGFVEGRAVARGEIMLAYAPYTS
jgi:3-hydroxyacyl-[acyl-carrier-protein] dehydratase